MSIGLVKADLDSARSAEEADAIFKSAYASGFSLQELGDIVGWSREYIRQRISRPVDIGLLRDYPPAGRIARAIGRRTSRRIKATRILGLRLTSPALEVPVVLLNELSELMEMTTQVRGWTPLDSPARNAIKPFGELLEKITLTYGIPRRHLERLMGVSSSTFTAWRRSHGYLKQSPSQTTYQGVVIDHKRTVRGPALVLGGHCKRGHEITEFSLGVQKAGRYCKTCQKEGARRRYQERTSA